MSELLQHMKDIANNAEALSKAFVAEADQYEPKSWKRAACMSKAARFAQMAVELDDEAIALEIDEASEAGGSDE